MTESQNQAGEGTVAERYLARLREHGIRYLFGNAGTDFPPLIEAFSRGDTGIEPVLVPHENVAVAMAYGYAMVTGQPQLVMVHVGLGTANALCGLFNAARQQVPLLLTAGRSPWLEHGRLGARNNYINWAQEMYDQSGMVRELVKWEYELRDPAQVEAVVDRALAAACSAPQGPAYLVLPREVLAAPAAPCRNGGTGIQAPVRPGLPSTHDLETARRWLTEAQRPLIITADTGRTRAGFDALTAFAEQRGIPVVQYRPRHLNLPCSSHVNAGYDPTRLLPQADLVLAIDVDVPWLPELCAPQQGARVVHIGLDPLFLNYPIRGFRSDLSLQGETASILEALLERVGAPSAHHGEWLDRATRAHRATCVPADDEGKLTSRYVSRCIAEAMDEQSVLINEYTFTLEELRLQKQGNYFGHSPAGGLGWGVGAAMGVRMARPDAVVFAAVGDGTYMFSNPTPAHYVSAARGLPFITVVYNNRRWAAVHRATLSMYPDGAASRAERPVFSTLEPEIAHERIVEACGGLGIRVDRAEQLPAAIERAIHAVRHEGRQAVINVLTEVSYTRTS